MSQLAETESCSQQALYFRITVYEFSYLECQRFFKFELELQVSISNLVFFED